MKKKSIILSTFLVASLLLSACNNDKWQGDISHLDQGWIDRQYELIDEFEQKLEENPDDYEALFEIGFRYDQLEDFKKAAEYYKKTLEVNPDWLVAYHNLASVYEKVEEYDLAAENIMIYFQNNQDNSDALKDTVRILLKADDPENAQIALDNYAMQTADESSSERLLLLSELKQDIYEYESEHTLVN